MEILDISQLATHFEKIN